METRTKATAAQGLSPLAERYRQVRAATERLIEPLSEEDCQIQSMPDASPVKWNVAHTSWFFETFVLRDQLEDYRVFHPHFGFLFNSYYDSVGERVAREQRGLITRPSLGEVRRYRAHVDQSMRRVLERGELPAELLQTIEVGLNHEQQHQELLLTDLKHALSCNPMQPAYQPRRELAQDLSGGAFLPQPPAALEFVSFSEELVEIGHASDAGFAFDNECPRHRVFLEPFELASRPVTNAEYQAFIAAGGYEDPQLWLSDGWAAREAAGWRAPAYWRREDTGWTTFTLSGRRPLNPAAPVTHISYYEADAYATWSGARLPTEAEWEHAANCSAPEQREDGLPGNLLESGPLHPQPLPFGPGRGGAPKARIRGMLGDVWEWTASAYSAYPGYRTWNGSLGEYNGKFMVNQMVLRGGSCVTPADHIRSTYRNFFHPDARWQFSGIRLAR